MMSSFRFIFICLFLTAALQQKCQSNAFTIVPPLSLSSTTEKTNEAQRTSFSPRTASVCSVGKGSKTLPLFAGGYDDARSSFERNVERTNLRRFLTQRSVQSFMFLCQECRDPHTIRWLDEFSNTTDLVYYHGTGAIDTVLFESWDSYFLKMMEQPDDFITVQARRRGRGNGGWSKNNPYLQDRFVEFRIDIRPSFLATRILSVREQLAREWFKDLDLVIMMEDQIMESYFENVIRARENEEECSDLNSAECEQLLDGKGTGEVSSGPAKLYGNDPGDPYANNKRPTFDRNAMIMIRSSMAFEEQESSPLRKGSFDLLLLLATHESIHRILRQFKDEGDRSSSIYQWFRDFYTDRTDEYFDGPQNLGRADDFLEELLLTSPVVKKGKNDKSSIIIDPLGIAEKIIRTRCEVSREWKNLLAEIPNDHIGLRRQLFSRQMQSTEAADKQNDSVSFGENDLESFM